MQIYRSVFRYARILASIAILCGAVSANAAPLSFDCDARTNATASVKNLAQIAPAISGTITAKRFRKGQVTPGVGATIAGNDGKSIATFRLTAATVEVTEFDLILSTDVQGVRETINLGKLPIDAPITFRLFVDQEKQVHLFINNQSWRANFTTLQSGQEVVFCSTGQFEVSNLRFSD